MSKNVLPLFSSTCFIVSALTLRALIHFEFISVYGVRKCSSFIFLQMVDQFSQHHLLKRLSFLHCIFWEFVEFSLLWSFLSGIVSVACKVSWLGRLVLEFWWVELGFFSLECSGVTSNGYEMSMVLE